MLQTFLYKEGEPLDGILNYFYTNFQDDYYNLITATASHYDPDKLPTYAIDFVADSYWFCGQNRSIGEYITFSFPKHFVELQGFVVHTTTAEADVCHPKHFSFSASNDNISFVHYKYIDDDNGEMFNAPNKWKYFSWHYGIFQYYRINITGEAHCGSSLGYRMDLDQVEFYGTIIPINEIQFNCSCSDLRIHYHLSLLFCIML